MRRAGIWFPVAVFLIVLFCDSAATSIAASPEVAIKTPLNGSVINTHTPSFSGSADGAGGQVTLMLYKGVYAEGTLVQELSTLLVSSGSWSVGPAEMLESGTYTAQASQSGATSKTNRSSTVTFTVSSGSSTPLPTVTLNSPQAPPGDAAPSFTGAASDTTPVEIQIHAGITAKGPVVSRATAAGTGAIWTSSNASPELSVGQYTAVAIQTSLLGGAGRSQPMTFTVTAAPLTTAASFITTPPAASFRWLPSAPHTGEPVSLVSTSTDPGSPITAFAWALT